jgi:hypothetical protein
VVVRYRVSRPVRFVAAGYAQLGGIEGWDFVSASPQGGLNPIVGCVASDSSDLDAALPTRGRRAPQTRRPFFQHALSNFPQE